MGEMDGEKWCWDGLEGGVFLAQGRGHHIFYGFVCFCDEVGGWRNSVSRCGCFGNWTYSSSWSLILLLMDGLK